jgi:hypothetical protein
MCARTHSEGYEEERRERSRDQGDPIFRPPFSLGQNQGCQIFLGTKYQNGEKYTKLPLIIPNVHKI